jgi:hypothetical protein
VQSVVLTTRTHVAPRFRFYAGLTSAASAKGSLVIHSLRDRVRGFLNVRSERAIPRRGPKPAIGAQVALGDLRMTIQAGFSDDLWYWLQERRWRELRYRPEHRHYREVPSFCVGKLIEATTDERPFVLIAALARASPRPILGNPDSLPCYVVRH